MKSTKKLNYINIFIYFYLLISIFLFCYTFYRAEIIYKGEQFSYYYKYYLIFIFSAIFWSIALFFKKNFLIIVSATCFVFFLYFYETVSFFTPSILKLKLIKSMSKKTLVETQLGEGSKYYVIENLKKKENIEVVPSIFPKALLDNKWENKSGEVDILPLGGVSNTTTVFCKEGDEFSIYKSDRYGFNNPNNQWENKKVFWILIGDSFVQGSCVQPGEDFASQIRILTKQSAISLGMSGNGPLLELASLIEYGLEKKPQIVLWFYFERNDLDDLNKEKKHPILIKYLKDGFTQNLNSQQNMLDKKLKEHINFVEKDLQKETLPQKDAMEKFLAFKKIIRLQIIRDKTSLDRGLIFGVDPLFKQIILNAKKIVNQWGGKLYFVYLPDKERYSSKNVKDDTYLKRSQVLELIQNLNISLIDIHKDFFMKQNDPISFFAHRIYGHYSPDGYHKISNIIVNKIKKK